MADESQTLVRTVRAALATPAALAVVALAGYLYEQSRTTAFARHFGISIEAGDPRQAVVVATSFGLMVLIVFGTLWLAVRASDTSVAASAIIVITGSALITPHGWSPAVRRVELAAAVVALVVAARTGARAVARHLLRAAARHPHGLEARLADATARCGSALKPPPMFTLILLSICLLVGAQRFGAWLGRYQAETLEEFVVTKRDTSSATVIFEYREFTVERVLDTTPGHGGQPRNVWLPAITIRPVSDAGIRYELVRLGRTERATVTQP